MSGRTNSNSLKAFIALVQAGLWEQEVRLASYGKIDYTEVLRLAEEQSVVGLVAAGLEHVTDVRVPKEDVLQFVGQALQLEQSNTAMNCFIEKLIGTLRCADVYTLLVKGQGIAQCYGRPLWRACGDVDLLLSDNNYTQAEELLKKEAISVEDENHYNRHLSMNIDGWTVELHGTLRGGLWRRLDKEIDIVQDSVFYGGNVRSWINGKTTVFLPAVDEDVIFVFSHILQHYFKEGIGLRQICDWCRLLWTYKGSIDKELLEKRIKVMGVTSEWKAFAALAVEYLGMPKEIMPFYSSSKRWKRKAKKIISFVFETGNFGHNRDYSYYEKYPYLIFKLISFGRHVKDGLEYFKVFPLDSIKVIWRGFMIGFFVALQGKRHE